MPPSRCQRRGQRRARRHRVARRTRRRGAAHTESARPAGQTPPRSFPLRRWAVELRDLADPGRQGRQRGRRVQQHGRGGGQRPGAPAQARFDPARGQAHPEPLGPGQWAKRLSEKKFTRGTLRTVRAVLPTRVWQPAPVANRHLLAGVLAVRRGEPAGDPAQVPPEPGRYSSTPAPANSLFGRTGCWRSKRATVQ